MKLENMIFENMEVVMSEKKKDRGTVTIGKGGFPIYLDTDGQILLKQE
jgi:hypothetical protein